IIYVLLILVAMQLIGVYFVSSMKNSLTSNFTQDLQARAEMLSVLAEQDLSGSDGKMEEDSVESLRARVNNLFDFSGAE
ncbi:cell wall metabolism sensor histidine kinase WalK, partial [Paenibacillus sp. EKM208P]